MSFDIASLAMGMLVMLVMVVLYRELTDTREVNSPAAETPRRFRCDVCGGGPYDDPREARDHAIGEHPAIDATNWAAIMQEVGR